MFSPRSRGCLGLIRPRVMYYAKKLSFFLSVLNSDDSQTQHTARQSLALHMNKRKCEKAAPFDDNFAGYKTDDKDRVIKNTKTNWRKSQWVQLIELCYKVGVQLHLRGHEYVLRMTCDEVALTFTDPRTFFTCFKQQQVDSTVEVWKEKDSQGRIARTENVDHKLSNSHLANLHLSDSLVRFVTKARLQLAECNSLLHTYYPAVYTKSCTRCGFHSDTISHILNGCRKNKNSIQKRHNRLVDIVANVLTDTRPEVVSLKDQIVKPTHFDQNSADHFFVNIRNTRPDLCVINHNERTCLLVELAVPFDTFINDCYQHKFDKYFPLCQRISDMSYQCRIIVLVIGSLGSVHNKFVTGLKIPGVHASRAKAIAKYCSVSAMIGSKIIWKQRCKNIFL